MKTEKLRTTPAARTLAKRLGVNLFNVIGTGYKGRIHQEDVANFNYNKKIHISPLAVKIAEEHGIDLTGVKGSGHNEKVLKDDVLSLINDPKVNDYFNRSNIEVPEAAVKTEKPVTKPANEVKITKQTETPVVGDTESIPMSMMRKVIGKRMLESYSSIPTFIQSWDINMTQIKALRANLLEPIKAKTGRKLTITDLISMAVIQTLMRHKFINARLSEDENNIIFHNYVNLAMAVSVDDGLMVPVVKNAHKMSLSELTVALKDVAERTINKKITPDEQTGSTFTISNLGMYGVDNFTSIINQPNAAILSVASIKDKLELIDGNVTAVPTMTLSLASDHRIIDGVTGAKFMQDLKNTLENPISLLI